MKKKSFIAVVCALALVVPSSTAFAQSSEEGYGGLSGIAGQLNDSGGANNGGANNGGGGNASAPAASGKAPAVKADSGSLPFTGADLGILAAAGGMLVALGFGLRRLTYRPTRA